jgi:hypothetical protein
LLRATWASREQGLPTIGTPTATVHKCGHNISFAFRKQCVARAGAPTRTATSLPSPLRTRLSSTNANKRIRHTLAAAVPIFTGSNDPSSEIDFRRSHVTSLAFLVDSPFLALVPSAVLFLLAARARHWLVTAAATAWLLYAGYEWLMLHRVLCSGDCNIRIDLLILHPALIGLTMIALIVGLMRSRRSDVRGH